MTNNESRFSFRDSLTLKMFFVSILIIILLIPMTMVEDLVRERQNRQASVVQEVSEHWGYAQTLIGPMLTVPYRTFWKDDEEKIHSQIHKAQFLPDSFVVTGDIVPEIRSRGIFDVVVYRVNLHISGTFSQPSLNYWKVPGENILWEEAIFSIGMSDTRGIRDALFLTWDEDKVEFLSGAGNNGLFDNGIHTRLPQLATVGKETHTFNIEVSLNGNQQLLFVPVGKKTMVEINSTWPDPSFSGAFLPIQREITESGFQAKWEISHLGRNYPQSWSTQDQPNINFVSTAFGVDLLLLADFYQKTERSLKYGILFILLTFITFFLFEVLNPLRIHPLQYLLVGSALCLFYVLLLSISEQLGFQNAYLIATISTVSLITLYATKTLHRTQRALIMGFVLLCLYLYLYALLHLQDYALLFGAVGLFSILAIVMYITRNIDWYAVSLSTNKSSISNKP